MTPHAARRIRFGILAARHMLERGRLTDWQVDDVDGCKASGWKNRDSQKAFDRECERIQWRAMYSDLANRKAALRRIFGDDCPND